MLEEAGEAAVTDFAALHGDGPGYLLAGLGCDGSRQVLDDVSVGVPGSVTTYDLEGADVTTTISVSATEVPQGGAVTVTGTTLDARGVVDAPLVLQARRAGEPGFRDVGDPVSPGADGTVTARVTPKADTDYRWWFAERSWADAHTSPEVTIAVLAPAPSDGPSSTAEPVLPPAQPVTPTAPTTSSAPAPAPSPTTASPTETATPTAEPSATEPTTTP